jgi:hypothetical protein
MVRREEKLVAKLASNAGRRVTNTRNGNGQVLMVTRSLTSTEFHDRLHLLNALE